MTDVVSVALYFYRIGGVGGGAERMVCQLASALAKRGFIVHLITWDDEEAKSFYPIDPEVQWTKLGFAPGRLDKLRRIRALHAMFRRHDIKVLVGFVMSGDRTVLAAAKLAGVKLVAAERNAPEMYRYRCGPLQRWVTFRMLCLADRIAVQMATYTAGYPQFLRKRIVIIPNPVPIACQGARPDVADADGRFTVLTVSRLDPVQKRIGCLVGAFSLIAQQFPSWHLRIIGDGLEEPALHRRITELSLTGRVRIESSITEVFDVYSQSHLFAIPSRWEGFPNALAEAMSHGLPAVGFAQAAGVTELIGSDCGWLAAGLDDEAALAAALAAAMADAQERLLRGLNATQQMRQFTPDRQFDHWADLIRSLSSIRTP